MQRETSHQCTLSKLCIRGVGKVQSEALLWIVTDYADLFFLHRNDSVYKLNNR